MHIGKIIYAAVKHKEIGVTEFASKIHTTRRNAYKIFNRETIDTGLLIKINRVLGQNLFIHFLGKEEIVSHAKDKVKSSILINALKELEALAIVVDEERKKKERIIRKRKEISKRTRSKKD